MRPGLFICHCGKLVLHLPILLCIICEGGRAAYSQPNPSSQMEKHFFAYYTSSGKLRYLNLNQVVDVRFDEREKTRASLDAIPGFEYDEAVRDANGQPVVEQFAHVVTTNGHVTIAGDAVYRLAETLSERAIVVAAEATLSAVASIHRLDVAA